MLRVRKHEQVHQRAIGSSPQFPPRGRSWISLGPAAHLRSREGASITPPLDAANHPFDQGRRLSHQVRRELWSFTQHRRVSQEQRVDRNLELPESIRYARKTDSAVTLTAALESPTSTGPAESPVARGLVRPREEERRPRRAHAYGILKKAIQRRIVLHVSPEAAHTPRMTLPFVVLIVATLAGDVVAAIPTIGYRSIHGSWLELHRHRKTRWTVNLATLVGATPVFFVFATFARILLA